MRVCGYFPEKGDPIFYGRSFFNPKRERSQFAPFLPFLGESLPSFFRVGSREIVQVRMRSFIIRIASIRADPSINPPTDMKVVEVSRHILGPPNIRFSGSGRQYP